MKGVRMTDRKLNGALAKTIAYKQCGRYREAAFWADKLVRLLECAEILNDNLRPLSVVPSHRGEAA
jgi:hypothetical protein